MQTLRWNCLPDRRGLCHVAVTRLAEGLRTFPHDHDFFEMFLVLDGSGFHHRNERKIHLIAGTLVQVRPADVHCFSASPGKMLTFVNVAVAARWWEAFKDVADAPEGWERRGAPPGHFRPPPETWEELRHLVFRLLEPVSVEAPELMRTWYQAMRVCCAPVRRGPTPVIPRWLEVMVRDLRRPELVAEDINFWQRRSGRSPEHLARCCRRFYGLQLNELINRSRIERVKYLLQTTDAKVTQAAFEAGFNNLAHFYRIFQRLSGKTPHQWRLEAAKHAVPS